MDYRGFIEDKVVLVSGGVGTVGSALVDALLELSPREVRILDNNETELFLLAESKRQESRLTVHLGDVRDRFKLEAAMEGAQVVFSHRGLQACGALRAKSLRGGADQRHRPAKRHPGSH